MNTQRELNVIDNPLGGPRLMSDQDTGVEALNNENSPAIFTVIKGGATNLEGNLNSEGSEIDLLVQDMQSNEHLMNSLAAALELDGAELMRLKFDSEYLRDSLVALKDMNMESLPSEVQIKIKPLIDNLVRLGYKVTWAVMMVMIFALASCDKTIVDPETGVGITPVKDKYIEWSYEEGKDPLLVQIFTFPTGVDPATSFDISDTTKVEDVFAGHLEGTDYKGVYRKLDMTKNSWDDQVFPGVPVDVGGHEFSAAERDALFNGVKFTNVQSENLLVRASTNLTNIYNSKIKPELDKKAEAYFRTHNKRPKYQISTIVVPEEYYESGFSGTIVKMSDENMVVLTVEPLRGNGNLENYLDLYGILGHEFAGHGLNETNDFFDYIGKSDQLGYTVDGFGHVNKKAPSSVFDAGISTHLRNDRGNNSLLFPEVNKEFLSAVDSKIYGELTLMKTPNEQSNIPYIANMVSTKQTRAKEFMKNMRTGKQLVAATTSGARVSSDDNTPATIVSIHSCE